MAELSKGVTLRTRSADAVIAAANTYATTVEAALARQMGATTGGAARTLMTAVAATLGGAKDRLHSAEAAHAVELVDDHPVRKERDDAVVEVRTIMVGLRRTLDAVAPQSYIQAIGLAGGAPEDPTLLQRQAALVASGLAREPVPPSLLPSYTFPAAATADQLRIAADRLQKALFAIARESKENQESLAKRDQAMAEFDTVFRAVANVTSTMLAAAGQDELARRVRPSTRRSGQTAEVEETATASVPVAPPAPTTPSASPASPARCEPA